MTTTRIALALAAALASPAALHAQTVQHAPTALQVTAIDGGITVDGVLDDAAWAGIPAIDVATEISPGDSIAAPVRATLRIASTSDAVYLAFHAEDPDPEQIRAHLTDRDGAFNDDFVGVMLDTFDDGRRGYEFFVNPLGVQMDLVREDATGNEDDSWDGLWTSAGRITATGYDVEVRIPFSTLRFRSGNGPKRWGVLAFRNYPRNVRHQISNVAVPRGGNCLLCKAAKIEGMAGAQQGRNLEVVPTLTVTDAQLRDSAGSAWRGDGVQVEPGLDVAWAPTPNLTLNATLNPDFSQVESDQAQLDLTSNFALFFPEKRPFFMEGADYFNTPLTVLYTRQIADPDAGLRVTGRSGSGAYGAFVARDATTQLLVPGVLGSGFTALDQPADVFVGRYRHDLNDEASIGVITTARHGEGYRNDVAGIDGRWRHGKHTASAQVLRSDSLYPDTLGFTDRDPSGNAWRGQYNWSSRTSSVTTSYQRVDPGFRADLGFIGQVGYDKALLGGSRNWFFDGKSISRVQLYADYDITHRFDGQRLESELESTLSADGPLQSHFGLMGLTRERFWNGRMFDESFVNLFGQLTPRSGIQFGGNVRMGPQLDLAASRRGMGRFVDVWGNVSIGRGLSFNADLFQQSLRRDGGTAYEATVLDTRLAWQLDPRQRVRLTLQASQVDRDPALYTQAVNRHARDIGTQLIYSYKVNPRTAVFAGGTLGGFIDDDNRDLFASRRGVFFKLSYGWQP